MRRRRFLTRAAEAATLGPLWPLLSRTSHAARRDRGSAKRVMFVYIPDGCIPPLWHPTGGETDFVLSEMTAPLEPIRDQCVFLDGLEMFSGGATHEGGVRKVLTGAGDVSLDLFLEQEIGGATPFGSVQLGVGANFQNGSGVVSFSGKEQQVTPEDNPRAAFDRLLAGVSSGGGDPTPEQMLALAKKRSILDLALGDVKALQKRLGNTEKQRLTDHLDALREIEARLDGGGGGSCETVDFDWQGFQVDPNDFYPQTWEKEELFQLVGELQTDIAVLSLSCDITRVVTLMWSHPVSPVHVLDDVPTGHHDVSHYGEPGSQSAKDFVRLQQWFCDRYVELIEKLRNTPDTEGTLLDNTLVVLFSEVADSNLHDFARAPFVLTGGANLGLQGGRLLDFSNAQGYEAHSKMLVSVAQAMGVDIDTFGYTGHGSGGLPGLFG